MTFLKRVIATAVSAGLSVGVAAAQSEQMLVLDPDGFKEIMRDSALISGALIVGAQAHGDAAGDELLLRGYLPAEWAGGKVCLMAMLINGFYEATGSYSIPTDWSGGVAILPFPSQHQAMLGARIGDGLSLRVSRAACDAAFSGEMSLALANRRLADSVSVMINSFRADAAYLYVGAGETPVLCEPIELPARTAFDMRCTVPLAGLSGSVPIEVFRVVERKVAPPTAFTLWLPDE